LLYILFLEALFVSMLLVPTTVNAKSTVADTSNYFEILNYNLKSRKIPPLFLKSFPLDLNKTSIKNKTSIFIKIMLPQVLLENNKIFEVRNAVLKILEKKNLSANDIIFLETISKDYNIISNDSIINPLDKRKLDYIKYHMDRKVRPIPVPIALAQAALESGWGTSRFVKEGNNLFGHVAINPKNGIKPKKWSGKDRHIRKFSSITESISRYMKNLNRNRAYWLFREYRYNNNSDYFKMSEGFLKYSRIGNEYIVRLKKVIRKYKLYKYSDSILDSKERLLNIENLNTLYIY